MNAEKAAIEALQTCLTGIDENCIAAAATAVLSLTAAGASWVGGAEAAGISYFAGSLSLGQLATHASVIAFGTAGGAAFVSGGLVVFCIIDYLTESDCQTEQALVILAQSNLEGARGAYLAQLQVIQQICP